MEITIRKFQEEDIPLKVKWINSQENNEYLHYDIPINEENTLKWFKTLSERPNRADFTILANGVPAGLIGILDIDKINRKAELYIVLGEEKFKGKGISDQAIRLLLNLCTDSFNLNKIYLYTEEENRAAQKLFERCGFVQEGLLKDDLIYQGEKVNRFIYGIILDKDTSIINAQVNQ